MRRWAWAPRSVLQNRRRLRDAHLALNAQLMREPTRAELAFQLGVDATELDAIETHSQHRQVVSLHDP